MKKVLLISALTVGVFLFVTSCGESSKEESIGDFPPLKVHRLDKVISEYSKSNDKSLLEDSVVKNGVMAVTAMLNMGHPNENAFDEYVKSEDLKVFSEEVNKTFPDLASLENILGGVKINIEKELAGVKMCDIYSIVSTNRHHSIYMTDSLTMLLVLNHYLGANHDAYKGFDEYIKATKDIKFIPYDIVEALIANTSFAYLPSGEENLLTMLMYQGALIEAKMRIVPGSTLALALGYNEDQLKWLEDNEQKAWESIVSQEMIYSTSPDNISKLISPAPTTTIINANAPGRAGRYFGYKIVKAYLEKNPSTTLAQLLSPTFYSNQKSFIASGYQGK